MLELTDAVDVDGGVAEGVVVKGTRGPNSVDPCDNGGEGEGETTPGSGVELIIE